MNSSLGLTQISDTISFDMRRNLKKTVLMLILYVGLYILLFAISQMQFNRTLSLPSIPEVYTQSFLNSIFIFMLGISSTSFAGSIIVEDFEKNTGNLLFPKVNRTRLLVGRILSRSILNSVIICIYYVVIGLTVQYNYGNIPLILWRSMGWALLYALMIMSFVTFMSCLNKKISSTVVVSLLCLVIIFEIIESVLMFTGLQIEPLFCLPYFADIISNCLNMPNQRTMIFEQALPESTQVITYTQWITPSSSVALIGMLFYTIVFLSVALVIFQKRHMKN